MISLIPIPFFIIIVGRPGLQRTDSGCFAPLVLLTYSYKSGAMCHGDVHDSGIDLGLSHTTHSLSGQFQVRSV